MTIEFSNEDAHGLAYSQKLLRGYCEVSRDPRAEGKYLVGYLDGEERFNVRSFRFKFMAERSIRSLPIPKWQREATTPYRVLRANECWMT